MNTCSGNEAEERANNATYAMEKTAAELASLALDPQIRDHIAADHQRLVRAYVSLALVMSVIKENA